MNKNRLGLWVAGVLAFGFFVGSVQAADLVCYKTTDTGDWYVHMWTGDDPNKVDYPSTSRPGQQMEKDPNNELYCLDIDASHVEHLIFSENGNNQKAPLDYDSTKPCFDNGIFKTLANCGVGAGGTSPTNPTTMVTISPTCDIDPNTQTITVTDGYDDYLANLPGSELEYIGPAIASGQNGYLNARTYTVDHLPRIPENPTPQQKLDVQEAWQDRDELFKFPQQKELMATGMQLKSELDAVTQIIASGGTPPDRTEVFSYPVNYGPEQIDGEWRNNFIPLEVYKFWGLFVPQLNGEYKIRFQKDDGLIVHLNLGAQMEVILNEFVPGSFNEGEEPNFNSITTRARNGGSKNSATDGTDVFTLVSGTPYPIHMQWFNYDGPHALRMQYAPKDNENWVDVPESWFNPGTDPRGIDTIESDTSPSNIDLDIPFTKGDFTADGSYSQINEAIGGTENIVVTNLAGYQTTCSITLEGSNPPEAKATVSSVVKPQPVNSINVLLGELVTFDGATSSDRSVESYRWDLSDSAIDDRDTFTHRYDSAGTYTATLVVIDDMGLMSAEATVTVVVLETIDITPPVCSVNVVDLAASGSASDEIFTEDLNGDGQINYGETDSNGNGKIDYNSGIASVVLMTGSDNLQLSSNFSSGDLSATFDVTLIDTNTGGSGTILVTDVIGNECQAPVIIDNRQAPTAVIEVKDALDNPVGAVTEIDEDTGLEYQLYVVNEGVLVSLLGRDSEDLDGTIVSYLWQGVESNAQSSNTSHTFNDKETKIFTLTVTDNDGLTDSVFIKIRVNEAPIVDIGKITITDEERANAVVTDDKIVMEVGKAIVLDASGSTDDEGIEVYTWCPNAYFNEQTTSCDVPAGKEHTVGHGAKYEYLASSTAEEQVTLILEDAQGARSATTFTIAKFESSYTATGSMGIYLLSLLGALALVRRRQA